MTHHCERSEAIQSPDPNTTPAGRVAAAPRNDAYIGHTVSNTACVMVLSRRHVAGSASSATYLSALLRAVSIQ